MDSGDKARLLSALDKVTDVTLPVTDKLKIQLDPPIVDPTLKPAALAATFKLNAQLSKTLSAGLSRNGENWQLKVTKKF
ncbi:hypothetical protein LUCX_154 [Xanthomonas phage vB_XciM_LucasX]|nr:hypothetical protein LUCX_154 [Xanthomonas phage vB_XciM_LucasX]